MVMLDINKLEKPADAKEFHPEGATVPFYEYKVGEGRVIEFDTSECGPPEPMVNAMIALQFVDPDTSVVMINHKKPMGLLGKIEDNYDIRDIKMPDGKVKLLFTYKKGASENADLNDASCHG
jgi:hypothetical protein